MNREPLVLKEVTEKAIPIEDLVYFDDGIEKREFTDLAVAAGFTVQDASDYIHQFRVTVSHPSYSQEDYYIWLMQTDYTGSSFWFNILMMDNYLEYIRLCRMDSQRQFEKQSIDQEELNRRSRLIDEAEASYKLKVANRDENNGTT